MRNVSLASAQKDVKKTKTKRKKKKERKKEKTLKEGQPAN